MGGGKTTTLKVRREERGTLAEKNSGKGVLGTYEAESERKPYAEWDGADRGREGVTCGRELA